MGLRCALHVLKWNVHAHALKVSPGTPLGTSPGSHGQLLAIPTVSTVFYTHRDPASTRSWPSVVLIPLVLHSAEICLRVTGPSPRTF